jgi:hypothetical protein
MTERHGRPPAIRIWAPAPEANPEAHANMKRLADNIELLEKILGENGVTAADVMPPLARRLYVPDDDMHYEIFAHPSTLRIGHDSEGGRISIALDEHFGLFGALRNPMASDAILDSHVKHHGLSLMASRNVPDAHGEYDIIIKVH